MVRLRGRLHHYAARSPKLQPTPFNQRHFEAPARLMLGVTTHVILTEDLRVGPVMMAEARLKGQDSRTIYE